MHGRVFLHAITMNPIAMFNAPTLRNVIHQMMKRKNKQIIIFSSVLFYFFFFFFCGLARGARLRWGFGGGALRPGLALSFWFRGRSWWRGSAPVS